MPKFFRSRRTNGVEQDTLVINMYVPYQVIDYKQKKCYSIKCEFKLDQNNSTILDFLLNEAGNFTPPYNLQYFSSDSYLPLSNTKVDVQKIFSSSAEAPNNDDGQFSTALKWYNCLRSYGDNDLIQAGHGIYFHVSNKTNGITVDWGTSLISAQLLNPVSHQAINQLKKNLAEQGEEGNEAEQDEEGDEAQQDLTVYVSLNIPERLIQLYYNNDKNESISVGDINGVTFYGKNSVESAYKPILALTICDVCVGVEACSHGNGGNESSGGSAYKKKNRRSRARKSSKKRKVRKSSRRRSSKRNTRRYRKSRKQNRKH